MASVTSDDQNNCLFENNISAAAPIKLDNNLEHLLSFLVTVVDSDNNLFTMSIAR